MRTLGEHLTEAWFPLDAERKLLLEAAEQSCEDGEEFMRCENKEAATRLKNMIKNNISAISCTGLLAADMGDKCVVTKSYVFGVTYETKGAKEDARKLRVLLMQEDTLKEMQPKCERPPAEENAPEPLSARAPGEENRDPTQYPASAWMGRC